MMIVVTSYVAIFAKTSEDMGLDTGSHFQSSCHDWGRGCKLQNPEEEGSGCQQVQGKHIAYYHTRTEDTYLSFWGRKSCQ